MGEYDNMAVTLTVSQLKALVRGEMDEAVRPIRERIERDGYGVTDVRGVKTISTILCITTDRLSKMVESGCLGKVLWKDMDKGKNTAVYGTMPMMKTRYKAFRNFAESEQKAWMQLGGEMAEIEWKKRGF